MTEATSFTHLHRYEPHRMNNIIPKYGILPQIYHNYLARQLVSFGDKYSGMKKNSGPPYYRIAKPWPVLENNPDYKRFKDLQAI